MESAVDELRHDMVYAAHVLRYGAGRGFPYVAPGQTDALAGLGIGFDFLTGVDELDLLPITHDK